MKKRTLVLQAGFVAVMGVVSLAFPPKAHADPSGCSFCWACNGDASHACFVDCNSNIADCDYDPICARDGVDKITCSGGAT
jgi:hypothetical protein